MGTCGVKGPVHTECSREVGCMNLFNKSTTIQHDCLTTVYICIHPINNPGVYQVCHVLWWRCELVQSQVNNCQATPYQQCEEPVWIQATCYTDLNVRQKKINWVYESGDCQVGASEPPESNPTPVSPSLLDNTHSDVQKLKTDKKTGKALNHSSQEER